jgi:hypothetical protein
MAGTANLRKNVLHVPELFSGVPQTAKWRKGVLYIPDLFSGVPQTADWREGCPGLLLCAEGIPRFPGREGQGTGRGVWHVGPAPIVKRP